MTPPSIVTTTSAATVADDERRREVSIFWDYENVPLPEWCNAAIAAKAIVDAVSAYGRIVDRRLYFDFEQWGSFRPRDSSGLDSSGFDLINTPKRGRGKSKAKETLDKKLIADVLTFAWDSATRKHNLEPCVVLITGDGDYSYSLSKLRDRGIMTVVITGADSTVSSLLKDTADICLSLQDDILRPTRRSANTASPTGNTTLTTVSTPSSTSSSMSNNNVGGTVNNNANNNTDDEYFVKMLCRFIPEQCTAADGWVDMGRVLVHLQQLIRRQQQVGSNNKYHNKNMDVKERSKEIRDLAENKKVVQVGRRLLQDRREGAASTTGTISSSASSSERVIVGREGFHDSNLTLSGEMYIRLLPKGASLVKEQVGASTNTDSVYQDDTSKDLAWICKAIQDLECADQDSWVGGGGVGEVFRKQLPASYTETTPKEDMNARFKQARDKAIASGLIEIGRRKLQGSSSLHRALNKHTYVAVPSGGAARPGLSPETYLRLLPYGRAMLSSMGLGVDKEAGTSNAVNSKLVFISNFPLGTQATQVAQFLDMTVDGCTVERVELHKYSFKDMVSIAAHIQFSDPSQGTRVLGMGKKGLLVYRGRRVFANLDRGSPDKVAAEHLNRPATMSFIKQPQGSDGEQNVFKSDEKSGLDENHERFVADGVTQDEDVASIPEDMIEQVPNDKQQELDNSTLIGKQQDDESKLSTLAPTPVEKVDVDEVPSDQTRQVDINKADDETTNTNSQLDKSIMPEGEEETAVSESNDFALPPSSGVVEVVVDDDDKQELDIFGLPCNEGKNKVHQAKEAATPTETLFEDLLW